MAEPISKDDLIATMRQLTGGGHVGVISAPPLGGYNPEYEIERTSVAPYQLIIHERYNGVHLKTVCELDGLNGNVTLVHPQERVS